MVETALETLLENSQATKAFKEALRNLFDGRHSELITYNSGTPAIKIERVLMKLLDAFPEEPISSVEINGQSSCSAFRGYLIFRPGQTEVEFDWDCSWKAKAEGFETWYGQPDQAQAAQKFGYQCFRTFRKG